MSVEAVRSPARKIPHPRATNPVFPAFTPQSETSCNSPKQPRRSLQSLGSLPVGPASTCIRGSHQEIHSVRLTIRAGQVCELGAFSTPNQASLVFLSVARPNYCSSKASDGLAACLRACPPPPSRGRVEELYRDRESHAPCPCSSVWQERCRVSVGLCQVRPAQLVEVCCSLYEGGGGAACVSKRGAQGGIWGECVEAW
eukprot:scaffold67350_cov37-Phaeocystis_antarctica.AAC.1